MTDTDVADGNGAAESKRKQVSKRSYLLGTNGDEAERIEEASGARYTLLGGSGGPVNFDQEFGNPGTLATMCAIFGFHTKVGNVVNTVLNDKADPGDPDSAADAVREFLDGAAKGTWAERTGGVGVKIDKDALVAAIVEAYQAAGKTVDPLKARQLLDDQPAQIRKFRAVPEIAAAYNKRVGRTPATLDALFEQLD